MLIYIYQIHYIKESGQWLSNPSSVSFGIDYTRDRTWREDSNNCCWCWRLFGDKYFISLTIVRSAGAHISQVAIVGHYFYLRWLTPSGGIMLVILSCSVIKSLWFESYFIILPFLKMGFVAPSHLRWVVTIQRARHSELIFSFSHPHSYPEVLGSNPMPTKNFQYKLLIEGMNLTFQFRILSIQFAWCCLVPSFYFSFFYLKLSMTVSPTFFPITLLWLIEVQSR